MDVKDLKIGMEVVLKHEKVIKRAIILRVGSHSKGFLRKKLRNWVFLAVKDKKGDNDLTNAPFWCDPGQLMMSWDEYRAVFTNNSKKIDKKSKFMRIKDEFKQLGIKISGTSSTILLKIDDAERILNVLRGSKHESAPKDGSMLRLISKK